MTVRFVFYEVNLSVTNAHLVRGNNDCSSAEPWRDIGCNVMLPMKQL